MSRKPRTFSAPFSTEQVTGLNAYQQAGQMHPYTCGESSDHAPLVAARDGWHCLMCDYVQFWAHEFAVALGLEWLALDEPIDYCDENCDEDCTADHRGEE